MHTILIVDDEKGITKGLEMIIERNIPQYKVVGIGHNGIEGYNLAMMEKPDIIIADIRMPQVDGLDMIKRLKEDGCSSKVIILSGYSDFEYAKKGMALGVKFYITKPVEEEELFDCIEKATVEIDSERAQALEIQYLRDLYHSRMKDNEDSKDNSPTQMIVSEEELLRLESSLDVMDLEGCNIAIKDILDKVICSENMSLTNIKLQCLSIVLYVIRKMPNGRFQLNEFLGKNILSPEAISRFETVEQVSNWLINTFRSIVEIKSSPNISIRKDIITDIKEYISENYNKDVSLAELSNKFFMNPSYLSQLFKEKTGDTYLNYITKLRISKAKELLSVTDLKVYEICEMVGYSDTNYFSKLFEKSVGCRPSEYKKKTSHA